MKLILRCMECAVSGEGDELLPAEFRQDDVYETRCSKGHHRVVVLCESRYRILFEMGAMALAEGFSREAVVSFASSRERFYEHWVRCVLRHGGVEADVLDKAWKRLRRRSEREIGAFSGLYLTTTKKVPPLLDEDWDRFRNAVVHSGEIPHRSEVEEWAGLLADHIVVLDRELYKLVEGRVHDHVGDALGRARARGARVGSLSIATVLSGMTSAGDLTKYGFPEAMRDLKVRIEGMYER